jgi:AraC-like DNA-binding protein
MSQRNVKLKMKFENINPYVRFVNLMSCDRDFLTGPRLNYDHQFLYVHKGRGIIEIDKIKYQASPHDLFYYKPMVVHSITADYKDPFTLTGIHFDYTNDNPDKWLVVASLNDKLPDLEPKYREVIFEDFPGFPPHINLANAPDVKDILIRMVDEYDSRYLYSDVNLRGLFLVFLSIVSRVATNKREGIEGSEQVSDDIIRYLQNNYMENLTNEQLASKFYFHPNYLNHLIVTNTGKSIHQYLIELRIKKAVDMLLNTQLNISEIANAVGYSDIHYFSRLFKKKVGFTPNQVRKYIKVN